MVEGKASPLLLQNNDARLILRRKYDMIESKLKTKNCNCG